MASHEFTEQRAAIEQVVDGLEAGDPSSPYRRVWSRAVGIAKNRGAGPTETNKYAREIVAKVWVAHLWQIWRAAEGLPVDLEIDLPASQLLNEYDALDPTEFGWPEEVDGGLHRTGQK